MAVHQVAARCNRRRLRRSHALENACRPQPLRGVVKRPHTIELASGVPQFSITRKGKVFLQIPGDLIERDDGMRVDRRNA
nr:hypothetical protein [Burkholderia vietnamiensis]